MEPRTSNGKHAHVSERSATILSHYPSLPH